MSKFAWRHVAVAAALATAAVSIPAYAQDAYPTKPIRIVVPYTAGGGVDTVARLIGDKMSKTLGNPSSSTTSPVPAG